MARDDVVPGDVVPGEAAPPVLAVDGLTVEFRSERGWAAVVRDVCLTVPRGHIVGLVGESGSGKSVTALAMMGLVESRGGRVPRGRIHHDGTDVTAYSEVEWSRIRGRGIGMIFQDPSRALNPAYTVGEQIAETVRRHLGSSRKHAWARAVDMLDRVQIPKAAARAHDYPHTFSGGMSQRAMIAMALACGPDLLIADEPTTALDATVQVHIVELLRSLNQEQGIAILMITHDLGVVAELCESAAVMYAGQVVETGEVGNLFTHPRHPYTDGLLTALPRVGHALRSIPGTMPPPGALPAGCHFHPRCAHAVPGRCDRDPPQLRRLPSTAPDYLMWTDTAARCLRADELHLGGIETE